MAVKYYYINKEYTSESDAQTSVSAFQSRLNNNPTDWMTSKEITGSPDAGWQISPVPLTDAELLNPNADKTYMAYSKITGENVMPLTASELVAKRNAYRTVYAQSLNATKITKLDDNATPMVGEFIDTTLDMSGYV